MNAYHSNTAVSTRHGLVPPNGREAASGVAFRFDVRLFTCVMVAIECGLLVTFLALSRLRLLERHPGDMFNLDVEGNVPSWFSGSQFVLAAIPALVRGLQLKAAGKGTGYRIYFAAAAFLVFLSLDEIAGVHDLLPRLTAVIVYGGVVLVGLALMWRDVPTLLGDVPGRRALLLGAGCFVFGAAVMDGMPLKVSWSVERGIEEFCEMFGATLMFYGFASKVQPFGLTITGQELAAAREPLEDVRNRSAHPVAQGQA